MALNIEQFLPGVQQNGGISTALPVTIAGNLTVTGTTNIASVSLTDLSTTGNTTLGNAASDTTAINGATTITTTSASGLTVGRQGATAPVLKINAATASVATGFEVVGAAAGGGVAIRGISSGTDEALTIDAKGTGTVTINGTATGIVVLPAGTTIGGSTVAALGVVTSTSATAVAVGRQGATNPVLNVNANAANVVTGINLVGAAAAGGMALVTTSSGTDEALTIDAKGTGTLSLNATATGNIVLGRAATGVSTSLTGGDTLKNATAVPATAGAVAAGVPITMYSTSITVEVTSDAPTHTRPKGSICINTGGGSGSTRMYINTDGAGTWTSFTTAG